MGVISIVKDTKYKIVRTYKRKLIKYFFSEILHEDGKVSVYVSEDERDAFVTNSKPAYTLFDKHSVAMYEVPLEEATAYTDDLIKQNKIDSYHVLR